MLTRRAWGVLIAVCLAGALYAGGVLTVERIRATARADERARLEVENTKWTAGQLAVQRAYFRHVVDSLAGALERADRALATRITRARRDTFWIPADTTPAVRLGACRAQLDTLATACELFRAQAAATLEDMRAAADSAQRADSAALAGASMLRAIALSARDDAERQLSRATRGRAIERGACVASGALNLFTLWRLTK